MDACHLDQFLGWQLLQWRSPAAEQDAGAPVQYMKMRRPAKSGAAASIQARRSLKQRMPGSSVCTPSCHTRTTATLLVWGCVTSTTSSLHDNLSDNHAHILFEQLTGVHGMQAISSTCAHAAPYGMHTAPCYCAGMARSHRAHQPNARLVEVAHVQQHGARGSLPRACQQRVEGLRGHVRRGRSSQRAWVKGRATEADHLLHMSTNGC